MSREWKPGDVAMWREDTVVFRDGYGDGRNGARWVGANEGECFVDRDSELRPLVVIDPEDTSGLDRLRYLLIYSGWVPQKDADALDDILREFANRKPPRPDEPTGLGAVVEAIYDNRFVRIDRGDKAWRRVGDSDPSATCSWGDIDAVRVLSEGVPS